MKCNGCGGTGDAWNREAQDWAYPARRCDYCKGSGDVAANRCAADAVRHGGIGNPEIILEIIERKNQP